MATAAVTFKNFFCGVDPAFPDQVYTNRLAVGPWERVRYVWTTQGTVTVVFDAANRVLSITPDGQFETRPAGTNGPWEQFTVSGNYLISAHGVVLEAEMLWRPAMPLNLVGTQLKDPWNRDVFLKLATAFLAYQMWLDGELDDLDEVLDQLQQMGCNGIVVFGMCFYIPIHEYQERAFDPDNYGDRYFEELPKFAKMLLGRGMYLYWCSFADAQIIMPGNAAQVTFHNRVVAAFAPSKNVLYRLANEPTVHSFNYVDPALFAKPTTMLACSGDRPANYSTVPAHTWDFGDLHVDRDETKGILDCCPADNPIYKAGKGLIQGEPCRYGSNGSPGNLPPSHARKAACAARAGAMGITFHSRNGVRTELIDAVTMPFAQAMFADAFGPV